MRYPPAWYPITQSNHDRGFTFSAERKGRNSPIQGVQVRMRGIDLRSN